MNIAKTPTWSATPHPGYQINSTAISADGQRCVLGTSSEYASGDFAVYGYNGSGELLWQDPLGDTAQQGVFWVSLSADGHYAAAGGIGSEKGATGFLRAYSTDSGERLLDQRLASRVNQVALSADGTILIAVSADSLYAYRLESGQGYRACGVATVQNTYCRSCAISADGQRMIVGASIFDSSYEAASPIATTSPADIAFANTDSGGCVGVFDLDGDQLTLCARTEVECPIMHVDLLPNGQWWAASRHDGGLMAFNADSSLPGGKPLWTFTPPDQSLSVAYGVALATRDDGNIQFVCGANLAGEAYGTGLLYAVTCSSQGGIPKPLWQQLLQHDPNPGLGMDRRARYVCATDGQPATHSEESAGNFYLFEGVDGDLIWRYSTSLMNWPMQVSANGCAAFGASDNGSAYYWPLN